MKLKFIPLLLLLPVLMLVLVACSGNGQPLDTPAPLPIATPTPTQVPPIATVAPLPPTPTSEVVIKEVEVTAIPLPTYTPLPTHTPLPTYTPLPTLTPQVIIKEIVITATPTPSPISTQTATLVPTTTPIPTQVPPTPTPTQVPTPTPTVTPTPTQSPPTPTPAPIPSPTPFSIPSSLLGIRVELVSSTQDFQQLTNVAQPDNGRNHIFVTEQTGQIHMFLDDSQTTETKIFLDIQNRISVEDNEEGLLGLAFDPEYSSNGYFYVYYSATEPRRSIVSRFSAHQNDTDMADPKSEIVVIEIPQPYGNHNGGQLAFGPDGYLYIGLGDGGAAWDPLQHGQNTNTLLGSILRIDVRNLSADNSYSIPSDNPFLGVVGMRDEIWAYGLRNPWRFSFDSATNLLWVGDVGQDRWEEINLVTKGLNYGWNIMEGRHCLNPNTECDDTGLEPPIVEYDHAEGCSITGGYVYRGTDIPWLVGTYVYGDFCSGKIWGLRYLGGSVVEQALLLDSDLLISSFGQSVDGVLYVLSRNDGIYRILPEE